MFVFGKVYKILKKDLSIMTNNNWRKDIDPGIKDHLETLIEDVHQHRNHYKKSKNPSAAQLWCVVARLSKHIFDLNLKIKVLEKALKDSMPKPSCIKDIPDKKEREDLMKLASNPKNKE